MKTENQPGNPFHQTDASGDYCSSFTKAFTDIRVEQVRGELSSARAELVAASNDRDADRLEHRIGVLERQIQRFLPD